MPPIDSPPLSYFSLFFTSSLFALITKETNRYAEQFLSQNDIADNKLLTEWLPVTELEMKVFIACILNMGLIRKPALFSYWSTTACNLTSWFSQMFPQNQFQLILKFFHFTDNSKLTLPYDPCAKFQPLCDNANRLFRHYYVTYKQLSIDESLVGTKSHMSLMQYLPKKQHSHRWGIKLWVLCDSITNYCLGFYVYKGAKCGIEEKETMKESGLAFLVRQNSSLLETI